jgi:hypothetical protein
MGECLEDEWQCTSPISLHSLPADMDYDKIDESVWDLEICGTNQVDADAFTNLEKSASAAYCSQVLEAFNLAETDEEISNGAESAEETGQMINLPKEIIDRIGSTRKNLFPVLDQFAFSAAKMESLPEKVESKTMKKKWGPVAETQFGSRVRMIPLP